MIKIIIIISVSYKISYCFEIDSVFADKNLTLATRINFTLKMAQNKYDGKKLWVVYSIEHNYLMTDRHRMMWQNSEIIKSTISENKKISLNKAFIDSLKYSHSALHRLSPSLSRERGPTIKFGEMLAHKIRVILDYSLESGNPCLYQVFIHQMEQPFDLDVRPIFWLGEGTTLCSINWLKDQFDRTKSSKLKQQIIAAIGTHDDSKEVVNFQKQIIFGNHSPKLKSEAIGWLGKHNSPESIKLLTFLAVKQKDIQLQKRAICALSQIHNKRAHAVVMSLALKDKNQEIREEAIFWLSQIAEDYALKTLNEILTTEDNPKIKNCVVFAISQLPESKATPLLYGLAQNDPDTQVRNKARFWLNRMKGQRIMDFFNDLYEEENRRGSN